MVNCNDMDGGHYIGVVISPAEQEGRVPDGRIVEKASALVGREEIHQCHAERFAFARRRKTSHPSSRESPCPSVRE
jgi:hypothetical protein